ncbi:hypothetical protein C8R44DRAFT_750742 [Mycena epipterygia]|nr:hypothetical protein C8R44DRAFT_750742 [Mycena epipterygia]
MDHVTVAVTTALESSATLIPLLEAITTISSLQIILQSDYPVAYLDHGRLFTALTISGMSPILVPKLSFLFLVVNAAPAEYGNIFDMIQSRRRPPCSSDTGGKGPRTWLSAPVVKEVREPSNYQAHAFHAPGFQWVHFSRPRNYGVEITLNRELQRSFGVSAFFDLPMLTTFCIGHVARAFRPRLFFIMLKASCYIADVAKPDTSWPVIAKLGESSSWTGVPETRLLSRFSPIRLSGFRLAGLLGPETDGIYIPLSDPNTTTLELQRFPAWISSYYKHRNIASGDPSGISFADRQTISQWTEEKKPRTTMNSLPFVLSRQSRFALEILKTQTHKGLFDQDLVASPSPDACAYMESLRLYSEAVKRGERVQPTKFKLVPEGNHFDFAASLQCPGDISAGDFQRLSVTKSKLGVGNTIFISLVESESQIASELDFLVLLECTVLSQCRASS